jgi:mRNA interferase MazF
VRLYEPGDVVVVPFPFSAQPDEVKRRPALVVASWEVTIGRRRSSDYLLALITSQATGDPFRLEIVREDVTFDRGRTLAVSPCFLRPSYLFAADEGLIAYRIGQLDPVKLQDAFTTLRGLFPEPSSSGEEGA